MRRGGGEIRKHAIKHASVDFGRNFRKSANAFTFGRGGVSLETEKGKRGTTSKLLITRALLNDSGNYTCASSKVTPASVMVHVLNGEQNTGAPAARASVCVCVSVCMWWRESDS